MSYNCSNYDDLFIFNINFPTTDLCYMSFSKILRLCDLL